MGCVEPEMAKVARRQVNVCGRVAGKLIRGISTVDIVKDRVCMQRVVNQEQTVGKEKREVESGR